MILAIALQIAFCTPALVYDADTLTCADGTKLRIAGVNGQELRGDPCPRDYPCPAMRAEPARRELVRVLGGVITGKRPKTGHLMIRAPAFRYRVVDRNRSRLVAVITLGSGRDLRCSLLRSGAVARWMKFERQYRLADCRE